MFEKNKMINSEFYVVRKHQTNEAISPYAIKPDALLDLFVTSLNQFGRDLQKYN